MEDVRGIGTKVSCDISEKKMEAYYDYYVSEYNKRKDALSFVSNMISTKEFLSKESNKYYNLRDTENVKFIKGLDTLYEEPASENYINDGKFIAPGLVDDLKFKKNKRSKVKSAILGMATFMEFEYVSVINLTEGLYDLCKSDKFLYYFTSPIQKASSFHDRGNEIGANYNSLVQILNKVILKGYPPSLDKFNDLSEEEKEKIQQEGNSNSHSLWKSSDWMDDAVKKIVRCETEEQVLSYLRSIDKAFKKPNPSKGLFFKTGRLNLIVAAECLAKIHNKRHPSYPVDGPAVKDRYDELSKKHLKELENKK